MLGLFLGMPLIWWVAGLEPGALQVIWSPYQKLAAFESPQENSSRVDWGIMVNHAGCQSMTNLIKSASQPIRAALIPTLTIKTPFVF